ncbi:amidohydrolase family protein [Kribbella swartbergensis]
MIDLHTHTPAWETATWLAGPAFGADDFIAFMDKVGAERAVVLSHDGLVDATPEANDRLAEFVRTYPDRLVGFGTVNVHRSGAPAEVERMVVELGWRGLMLHPWMLGHGGLHDLWRESLAMTQETDNLYLCICGTSPYAARRILADAPRHEVLFGTDAGLADRPSQDYALARVREIDGWGITDGQRHAMLVDNPKRLLEAL